jgi:hypothetical protein
MQIEEERLAGLIAAEQARKAIAICTDLSKIHPVAVQVQRKLEAVRPDEDWGQLRCQSPRLPYVRTTTESMPRALLLLSSILKAMDERGYALKEGRESASVMVDGERLYFSLEETARRVPHKVTPTELNARKRRAAASMGGFDHWLASRPYVPEPRWDFVATNSFTIKRRSWSSGGVSDAPRRPLEVRLNALMIKWVEWASQDRVERAEREARYAREQEAAERRAATARQLEIDQAALKQLLGDADRWATAERVRAYVRAALASPNPPQRGGSTEEWLAWASHYADSLDPTRHRP